eukprot:TCONS_00049266-protein
MAKTLSDFISKGCPKDIIEQQFGNINCQKQQGYDVTGKYFYMFENKNEKLGYMHYCSNLEYCNYCQSDAKVWFLYMNEEDHSLKTSEIVFHQEAQMVDKRRKTFYDPNTNSCIFVTEPKIINQNFQINIFKCNIDDCTISKRIVFDNNKSGDLVLNFQQGVNKIQYQLLFNNDGKSYLGIFTLVSKTWNFDLIEISEQGISHRLMKLNTGITKIISPTSSLAGTSFLTNQMKITQKDNLKFYLDLTDDSILISGDSSEGCKVITDVNFLSGIVNQTYKLTGTIFEDNLTMDQIQHYQNKIFIYTTTKPSIMVKFFQLKEDGFIKVLHQIECSSDTIEAKLMIPFGNKVMLYTKQEADKTITSTITDLATDKCLYKTNSIKSVMPELQTIFLNWNLKEVIRTKTGSSNSLDISMHYIGQRKKVLDLKEISRMSALKHFSRNELSSYILPYSIRREMALQ